MDAVSDDRGQALIVAALLLAIAAVVIAGLRLSQDAILARSRTTRATEAAVEAATAVVADAYVAELRRAAVAHPPRAANVVAALSVPSLREEARVAASDLSLRNGGEAIGDVRISCGDQGVEVAIVVAGITFRAGFRADECSPR